MRLAGADLGLSDDSRAFTHPQQDPLTAAARAGHARIVTRLIELGGEDANKLRYAPSHYKQV